MSCVCKTLVLVSTTHAWARVFCVYVFCLRFSECVGGLSGLAVAHRWSSLHWGHRDYPAGGKTKKRRIGSILSCENGDGLTLPRHAQDQLKQKLEENAVPFFRGPNRTAVRGRSRAATAGAGPSRCSRTSAGNVSSFAVSFIAFVPSLSWQAIVFHKEMEGKTRDRFAPRLTRRRRCLGTSCRSPCRSCACGNRGT